MRKSEKTLHKQLLGEKLATYIADHWRWFLFLAIVGSALLMGLRFDPKVSIGGDDSWYVLAAQDFWDGVAFPSWHGSFYPILLSPLLALLGGISLVPLKLLSVLFSLAAVIILGLAFRKLLTPLAWVAGLFFFSLTPSFIELASTTYSEPLFLLLQSCIFYFLFVFEKKLEGGMRLREQLLYSTLLGGLTFLLTLTRNVGYAAFLAILVYFFAIRRDWRRGLYIGGIFLLLQLLFTLYRQWVWGVTDATFAGQLNRALQIDFYNAAAGQEDLWGLVVRFFVNCKQYFSFHTMTFMGLSSAEDNWTMTIIIIALLLFILVRSLVKKRETLSFLGLYLGAMYGITFLTQQVAWNQLRLVLVYFPLFLFFVVEGISVVLKPTARSRMNIIVAVFVLIGFTALIIQNAAKVDIARIRSNLQGDRFAGYTPDWESYSRMSEWVGTNLPDSVVVACRKPNNSRIYGNRRFFGVFKLPSMDADTIRRYLDSNKVEYIMCGRLRRYTAERTEHFINTMHIMLGIVLREQPDYIDLVHHIGSSEPTLLFKLNRTTRSGSIAEQRHRLESGLYIYGDNEEAYYRLGRLSLDERRPDEAREYFLQARKILENEKIAIPYPIREGLALVYFAKGDFRSAIEEFEELTHDFPNEARLWYNLGVCYAKVGDKRAKECRLRSEELGGE